MTAPAPARDYKLGPVLPHVRRAAELTGAKFGVASILGWRPTAIDMAGHPAGRALDFMCSRSQGDGIADFLLANAEALGVQHVIWLQRYREPGGDWEPMEDRGSPTQNHMDHVHAKFGLTAAGVTKGVIDTGGGLLDQLNPFDDWSADLLGVGVKLTATAAALVLVVLGVHRTVNRET